MKAFIDNVPTKDQELMFVEAVNILDGMVDVKITTYRPRPGPKDGWCVPGQHGQTTICYRMLDRPEVYETLYAAYMSFAVFSRNEFDAWWKSLGGERTHMSWDDVSE